jgi:hypothetical protein
LTITAWNPASQGNIVVVNSYMANPPYTKERKLYMKKYYSSAHGKAVKKKNATKYYSKSEKKLQLKNWNALPHIKLRKKVSRIFKKYGVSPDDCEKMVRSQKGLCAICKEKPAGKRNYLQIDHNHVTGNVRGMLCNSCNTGLGLLKDNVKLLKNAIKYLLK